VSQGRVAGVLLTPGAGSSRTHSSLIAVEKRLAPLPVARVDFPYRREGRKAPDRPPKLIACIRDEATALAAGLPGKGGTQRLVLGGRSMGGRMCTLAAAGGTDGTKATEDPPLAVAGLVLVSYPLHPPGRPDKLRTEHLPRLSVPCLFVQGTKDPFGTPDELQTATAMIPGPVAHVWIEGGRHELKGADDEVATAVSTWLASLTGSP
jgi:predicted alpha/beta-hydrolase family hydrolase